MPEQHENTAQSVQHIMEKHAGFSIEAFKRGNSNEAAVVVLPEGKKLQSLKPFLDEYLEKPERRKGTAHMKDLGSFIAHAQRFSDEDSALFADNDMEKPSLLCVFDYHKKTSSGAPRFGQHRSHYAFPLSEEWKTWLKKDGEAMSQADFAEFLENHISDVMSPPTQLPEKLLGFSDLLGGVFASPSKLVELSRGLAVNEGAQVKQAVNLNSGETTIQYVSQHQDDTGAPLKVPNLFLIAIPVFVAGPLYQIAVRLRYRVRGGGINWFYELYRQEKVFEDAFEEACRRATEETKLPLFVGTPE